MILSLLVASSLTARPRPTGDEKKFLDATGNGNVAKMHALLDKGVNVNAMDSTGNTAIVYTVIMGDLKALKFLIKAGADVNLKYKESHIDFRVLELSLKRGNLEATKILLTAGVKVAQPSTNHPLSLLADFLLMLNSGKYSDSIKLFTECPVKKYRNTMQEFITHLDKNITKNKTLASFAFKPGTPGKNRNEGYFSVQLVYKDGSTQTKQVMLARTNNRILLLPKGDFMPSDWLIHHKTFDITH